MYIISCHSNKILPFQFQLDFQKILENRFGKVQENSYAGHFYIADQDVENFKETDAFSDEILKQFSNIIYKYYNESYLENWSSEIKNNENWKPDLFVNSDYSKSSIQKIMLEDFALVITIVEEIQSTISSNKTSILRTAYLFEFSDNDVVVKFKRFNCFDFFQLDCAISIFNYKNSFAYKTILDWFSRCLIYKFSLKGDM